MTASAKFEPHSSNLILRSCFLLTLFSLLIFLFAPHLMQADEIYLRSGDLIEGIVTEEGPDAVKVNLEGGFVDFKRSEIVRIRKLSEAENDSLRDRWRANQARAAESRKISLGGASFSLPFSGQQGFAKWVLQVHHTFHVKIMAFPPSALVLNLTPIASYRRDHPSLYVLGFYSIILLILTPAVAFLNTVTLNFIKSRRRSSSAAGPSPRP